MTILSKPLRRQLETAIKQAREIAEAAAKEAIARIGVADAEAPSHLSDDNKSLRRRLRAHGRTLGDTRDAAGAMTTARLQDAAAYEFWHRMLFGRFLVERGLLVHPDLGAAISVAELRELAREEGAADEWALAEQYAAPGLPGVFRPEDPVLALPIAPEFSQRLRAVLSGLPEVVFMADDSLGWTYQFWRASEKDAVNKAGRKIGATELPAVTQLFTESYMVKFLLHNTLAVRGGRERCWLKMPSLRVTRPMRTPCARLALCLACTWGVSSFRQRRCWQADRGDRRRERFPVGWPAPCGGDHVLRPVLRLWSLSGWKHSPSWRRVFRQDAKKGCLPGRGCGRGAAGQSARFRN